MLADLPKEQAYIHAEICLAAQRRAQIHGLLLQMKEATPKEEISRGKPFVSELN